MGISVELLRSEGFELTVDISHEISIDMGTGFGITGLPGAFMSIPVDLDKLKAIAKNLAEVIATLEGRTRCESCSQWLECDCIGSENRTVVDPMREEMVWLES